MEKDTRIEVSNSDPKLQKPADFSKSRCLIFLLFVGLFIVALIIAVVLSSTMTQEEPKTEPEPETNGGEKPGPQSCVGRLEGYKSAAIAADSSFCSKFGQEYLANEKASTVDAAIVTLLCVGVSNFHSTGLGGGDFFNIYDKKDKKFYTLDAREVAPLLATKDMYVANPIKSTVGALAIAVPGQLAGFRALHNKFGKLPWKELFQPIINLCKNGLPVSEAIAKVLKSKEQWIRDDPNMREIYIDKSSDKLYKEGQLVKMEKLAKTLEKIAEDGSEAFYEGHLTDSIVKEIKDGGGIISKDDLKQYKAIWREPVIMKMKVRGKEYSMASLEPPSSGILVEFIIKTMNGFGLPEKSFQTDPVGTFHKFIEVSKYAYAARAKFGDSNFNDNSAGRQNLTSEEYMAFVRAHTKDDATYPYQWYGNFSQKTSTMGTSHLSMVGSDGIAVASTSTINFYFGSKYFGDITGIMYNNEMDDFSTPGLPNGYGYPPSESNFIVPGKRPMSSMSPTIITDENGEVRFITGSSGGSRIISANAQVAIRNVLYGEDVKSATDAPRMYDQWLPPVTKYDNTFPENVIKGLEDIGHDMESLGEGNVGAVVQSIERKNGMYYPYADIRKGGCGGGV